MTVVTMISVFIGVLAVAGVLFVISDVRAYNQRKADVASRSRQGSRSTTQEAEMA